MTKANGKKMDAGDKVQVIDRLNNNAHFLRMFAMS